MIKESIYIREIVSEDTHDLRKRVLREGNDIDIVFAGDKAADTIHLGAFFYGRVIGITTLMASVPLADITHLSEDQTLIRKTDKTYQLRGMATDPEFRKMDVGRKLLEEAEKCLAGKDDASRQADVIWCHARKIALGFYKKFGYTILSDEFDIVGVGPHHIMAKRI
jgi:ribosomal protein S18 acetylase RimI-like enzyme